MAISKYRIEIGGRVLEIETGRLAGLAHGAVTVRYGDSVVLVSATGAKTPRPGLDFFPLTVDVAERMYAVGKLPGGFFKREGRPSTDAVLMGRLIDRPLRPLFPKGYRNEVQIIATLLSADLVNAPEVLGIIGASAALTISDIPFDDPIGACTIGFIDGELVVNPTYEEMKNSSLDLTVAGSGDAIMMVEAGAKFVEESVLVDALRLAQEVNAEIVNLIREMQKEIGKVKWPVAPVDQSWSDATDAARRFIGDKIGDALKFPGSKQERLQNVENVRSEMLAALKGQHDEAALKSAFHDLESEAVRSGILEEGRRPDGRRLDEIRPLSSEVGYLPRVHGSAIFTRGETQVLSTVTLGSAGEHQKLDTFAPETSKYFMHHYNFPPYSTGEVGRAGFTGRREIGHGALAERALYPVIPALDEFPYTIRVVSEVLSSNGSTSMASVCAGTLSLMDAGVPVSAPVAGIAMGLITGPNGKFAVLTDIQGAEDHSGDMDFKVAGTAEGVTALQMDIKVKGIDYRIMQEALAQARTARLKILDHLQETLSSPRQQLSPFAPRMITMKIPTDKIGAVIGPGGSVIRKMIEEFGVTIDIEDDGTVVIGSPDGERAEAAKRQIESMTRQVEVGQIYKGKVVRIMPFGAFVQLVPGKDGLVHISELTDQRVPTVESVVQIGDPLEVMVTNIDHLGRVDLSARAVLEMKRKASESGGSYQEQKVDAADFRPRRDRPQGSDRGGDRGGDRGRPRFDRERGGDRGPRPDHVERPQRPGAAEYEQPVRPSREPLPPVTDLDSEDEGADIPRRDPGPRRKVGGYSETGRTTPPPLRRGDRE